MNKNKSHHFDGRKGEQNQEYGTRSRRLPGKRNYHTNEAHENSFYFKQEGDRRKNRETLSESDDYHSTYERRDYARNNIANKRASFNKPYVSFHNNRDVRDFYNDKEASYSLQSSLSRRSKSSTSYNPHAKYSHKKRLEYKEKNIDPNSPIRLNKYLSNAGICSRRDADKYIEAGVVTVNGEIVTELGTKVLRSDLVQFHGEAIKFEKKVYVLLNKPKGYVTTSDDPQNRKTVMDLVSNAAKERIYPVGRLDRNTTGVLLLTNDGELAAKLTHPQFMKKKIYHVYLDKSVTAADLRQIAEGINLEDGFIKADEIQYVNPTDKKQVGIEIHSGRNRIVRRIFDSLGYHVLKLDRVYFAGLTKKHLSRGDWRYLSQEEVTMLQMGAFE